MSIIRKSDLQSSANTSAPTSISKSMLQNPASTSTVKKQRLQDVANPVTNIGTREPGSGTPWIGPITPYSLGGVVPEPGTIATLVPPQRVLQEEKKQTEAQGLVYNYTFNPTPDEGSGIPGTSPPSTIPSTSTLIPSTPYEIPYTLIIIGVLGLAGIYLLKGKKK